MINRDELLKKGFAKVDILTNEQITSLNNSINSQAASFAARYTTIEPRESVLDDLVIELSKTAPHLLYQFSQRVALSAEFLSVVSSSKVRETFQNLTGVDSSLALTQPAFSFLINPPKSRRLQYNWPTAFQSYPKRSCFLNFWMPAVRPKKADNGTLQVCLDSHKFLFPWVEGKALSRDGKNALTQHRVPQEFVDQFEVQHFECEPGSAYVMHPLLLHSSSVNNSNLPSYVFVFKLWTDVADYSLSSDLDSRLYSETETELVIPNKGSILGEYSMTKTAQRIF
jgi:hypothetical protein